MNESIIRLSLQVEIQFIILLTYKQFLYSCIWKVLIVFFYDTKSILEFFLNIP